MLNTNIQCEEFSLTFTACQNEYVSTGTLLHLLAFVGRQEAAEWLLKKGAYTHCRNHVSSCV